MPTATIKEQESTQAPDLSVSEALESFKHQRQQHLQAAKQLDIVVNAMEQVNTNPNGSIILPTPPDLSDVPQINSDHKTKNGSGGIATKAKEILADNKTQKKAPYEFPEGKRIDGTINEAIATYLTRRTNACKPEDIVVGLYSKSKRESWGKREAKRVQSELTKVLKQGVSDQLWEKTEKDLYFVASEPEGK